LFFSFTVEGDLPTSGQNSVNVFKQAAVSQTGSSSERDGKENLAYLGSDTKLSAIVA